MSIHLRASLVPAAAVIPAQVAYFDVVAVKKLVVCWYPRLPQGATESEENPSSGGGLKYRMPFCAS